MRSSSAPSLSTARRVGAARSASPSRPPAARSLRPMRANSGASATRARCGASPPASSCDRSSSCANCASSASTAVCRFATSGRHCASRARPRAPRCRDRARAAAGAGRGLPPRADGSSPGSRLPRMREPPARHACLSLELGDEVGVLVANRERTGENVVQMVPEGQHKAENDGHDGSREHVDLVALQRFADNERHERAQHESVERRLVDRGEVEAAQHDAEEADDEQRLVRLRGGVHRNGRQPPQHACDRRAGGPIPAPARNGCRAGKGAAPGTDEDAAPELIDDDQRAPRRHQPWRGLSPHRRAQECRAQQHRRGGPVPARIEFRDLVRACAGDERRCDSVERPHHDPVPVKTGPTARRR